MASIWKAWVSIRFIYNEPYELALFFYEVCCPSLVRSLKDPLVQQVKLSYSRKQHGYYALWNFMFFLLLARKRIAEPTGINACVDLHVIFRRVQILILLYIPKLSWNWSIQLGLQNDMDIYICFTSTNYTPTPFHDYTKLSSSFHKKIQNTII